ncbi:E3 SUMO-protein ligase KIAA1586-like [Lissotriton helveticus]
MSQSGQKKISSYFTKFKPKIDEEPASKLARKDHTLTVEEGNKEDEVREKALDDESDTTTSSSVLITPTEEKTQDRPLTDEPHHAVEIAVEMEETPSTSKQSDILSLKSHSDRLFRKGILPKGWKHDQKIYFQRKHPWLIVKGPNLGCSVCHQVRDLGAEKSRGMKLSKEWTESTVKAYGTNIEQQQKSLRKKIGEHALSKAHVATLKILENAKRYTLLQVTAKAQSVQMSATARIFRVAYKEAKRNRPAYGFEMEIDCHQLNGLDMGRILHSNVACSNIQRHISLEMKRKIFAKIIELSPKVSLLLDEATALNRKSSLIVYMRMQLPGMDSPANMFVDLIELSDLSADGIVNSLLSALKKDPINISEDFLSKCMVSVACDGASVMFGCHSGVVKRLQEKISSNIVAWHCSAHRLELAVHDVMKDIGATNHFKNLLDKLYSLFSTSVKNRLELKECAEALDVQLCRIGRVLDTRWVASSFRTVEAIWNAYPALYKHFNSAADDGSRDSSTRNMYTGLGRRLSSIQFVANLGLMYDALQELSELSLELQKRDSTIIDSHRAICRQIAVFEAMVDRQGNHFSLCKKAMEENIFQGVVLHKGKTTDKIIEQGQFFRSLAENLRHHLLSTGGTNSADKKAEYDTLISEVKVLYKQYWPDELPVLYGESDIESLCKRFNIASRETMRAYREYKESGGKEIKRQFKELLMAIHTIAISTAECERGFSQMNLICTSTRASLVTQTISSLMFLNLVGPPFRRFNPLPYVQSWLAKGRRSADDTRSKARKEEDMECISNLDCFWGFLEK